MLLFALGGEVSMNNEQHIMDFECVEGGPPVRALFLMATDNEYGVDLKSTGIVPVIVGVGPIESAINTTKVLSELKHLGQLPDIIINLGSGGSDCLEQGAVVQASSISYRDMDATGFGFDKGKTPFSELPAKLPISIRVPGIDSVEVSTGAKIISNNNGGQNEYNGFQAPVADMEAYAMYSAAAKYNVPFIKIVGISDGLEALTGNARDWEKLLPEIDRKLAQVVLDVQNGLASGDIPRDEFLAVPDFSEILTEEFAREIG